MNASVRQQLRLRIDDVTRKRLTGGLSPDPTQVGQCWHCGQLFIVGRYTAGTKFCSNTHKQNWYVRRRRFYAITDQAIAA